MYFRCSNSNNAWRTGITLTDSDLHAAYQFVSQVVWSILSVVIIELVRSDRQATAPIRQIDTKRKRSTLSGLDRSVYYRSG